MIGILAALSLAHGLNDAMQSIISAIYPLLKTSLNLSYAEIGIVALTYQISASIMQPIFGYAFDKRPIGWFLPLGMLCTMSGLILISVASSVHALMGAVFVSGIGSSIIHPEASRITSLAAGGRRGLAQSIFQVGGSCGFFLRTAACRAFCKAAGGSRKVRGSRSSCNYRSHTRVQVVLGANIGEKSPNASAAQPAGQTGGTCRRKQYGL